MRRVSEGFLLGESQLREAFTHLLSTLAPNDFTRSLPRWPVRTLRATLKNISLKPSGEPTHVASGIPGRRTHVGSDVVRIRRICKRGGAIG